MVSTKNVALSAEELKKNLSKQGDPLVSTTNIKVKGIYQMLIEPVQTAPSA